MNSEKSKRSVPHRLSLNLLDKINSKRSNKYVTLSQSLAFRIHEKIWESHTKTINLKDHFRRGMKNLTFLTAILCIRYSRLFLIYPRNMKERLIILQ